MININKEALIAALKEFKGARPFDHCIVDNFFDMTIARTLESEFIPYEHEKWFYYKNPIEDKKALNDWNMFPPQTYQVFSFLTSREFIDLLEPFIGKNLYFDPGLHGGGWHMHASGGNLNPHLDYSIHPKMGLQRKLNIIIYLSEKLKPEYGGHLGLWTKEANSSELGKLIKEVEPRFNRAVLFDTTQNSWHGMSRPITAPDGVYRKSFAVYYLCEPEEGADPRGRALFAARESQKGNPEIERIIKLRSDMKLSADVYRTK